MKRTRGRGTSLAVLCLASALAAAQSREAIFQSAAAALSAGDYAAAEQGFRRVLESAPSHIGALGNLGIVYSRTNRTAKAIEIYQKALRVAPNDRGLTLNLGLAYIKQDDHAEALPLFARLVAADPKDNQARELLATCQLATGGAGAAVESLQPLPRTAGVLYLLSVAYARLKEPEKAQAALDALLSNAATPAQANFLLGRACYETERFEEAAEHFRQVLEVDPQFPSARLELGKTYISLRASARAEEELRRVLKESPGDGEALHYLGALLLQDGRAREAQPYLEHALDSRPDSWSDLYYLGRAKLETGKAAEAVPLLERAARLNGGEASVYYQLGRALKACGRAAEAKRALDHFSELKAAQRKEEVKVLRESR